MLAIIDARTCICTFFGHISYILLGMPFVFHYVLQCGYGLSLTTGVSAPQLVMPAGTALTFNTMWCTWGDYVHLHVPVTERTCRCTFRPACNWLLRPTFTLGAVMALSQSKACHYKVDGDNSTCAYPVFEVVNKRCPERVHISSCISVTSPRTRICTFLGVLLLAIDG